MSNLISDEHLKETCKIAHGAETCRYLTSGLHGFECAKLTGMRLSIDARAARMHAQGDNCEGVG